ncbi:MAG: MFS transporter [bacterium]
MLALRERGLDFLDIGGLIAVRAVATNVLEIPTGALADALGRRRCMVVSMAAYVASYLLLGMASAYGWLALAMALFGVGDAFRSGTHKALIYTWLRAQGREAERTRVYGFTRSWSKIGSAVSSLLAGALVFFSGSYSSIFLYSALPALANLVNLATYPAWLDGERPAGGDRFGFSVLRAGLADVVRRRPLRRLIGQSLAVEGSYEVAKDYLQPVLQSAALAIPVGLAWTGDQRTAVLGGLVYAALFFLASFASRQSHRLEARVGDADAAAALLIRVSALGYAAVTAGLLLGQPALAILAFVALAVVQNLWRPIHVGRFDRDGDEAYAATTLSIESQATAGASALWAPIVGALIDHQLAAGLDPLTALWPVALLGVPLVLLSIRRRRSCCEAA